MVHAVADHGELTADIGVLDDPGDVLIQCHVT
jgi:hypothetical protein